MLLLQLAEVDLAVGDALLAAGQLGQLPVDVVFLRDHALLDLHDLVAPLAQLRLELGAELDRLLARLDPRLAPRRLGVALRLVEDQRRAAGARRRGASPPSSRSATSVPPIPAATAITTATTTSMGAPTGWSPARRAVADRRPTARAAARAVSISGQVVCWSGALSACQGIERLEGRFQESCSDQWNVRYAGKKE